MSGPKRNVLLAALLTVFFILGAFLIIRPAFQVAPAGDSSSTGENSSPGSQLSGNQDSGSSSAGEGSSPGPRSSGNQNSGNSSAGEGSSPGSQPSGNQNGGGSKPPVKAWRIGGATVDNQYPIENFNQGFNDGDSCAVLENLGSTLPITVVSVSVGPSSVYVATNCEPDFSSGATDLTGAVPCAPGVVLPSRQSRRGCSVGVKLLVTGRHGGTITFVTRVSCTTRKVAPCTLLRSDLNPTADSPITLTVDQQIGFTGSDKDNPITPETATPSPTPEAKESPILETATPSPTPEAKESPVPQSATPSPTPEAKKSPVPETETPSPAPEVKKSSVLETSAPATKVKKSPAPETETSAPATESEEPPVETTSPDG
jgi:hypothetical protein